MKTNTFGTWAAALLCCVGWNHVAAQTWTPEEAATYRMTSFAYETLPSPGIYQDFSQRGSGRGWSIDSVRAGNIVAFFAAFYHYTPDGKATWNTHQGNITQASVAEYTVDGLPAYVRGPMYVGQNGPCIDCPMVTSSLITAFPQRTMKIWGATKLQFEQLNGVGPMKLDLARSYSTTSRWQTLLDSGAVFSVTRRSTVSGTLATRNAGWVRFGKRAAFNNWDYVGHTTSRISNGQGGFLPSTMPAWLDIPAKNDIAQQWELVCVLSNSTVGSCDSALLGAEGPVRNDTDAVTWLLDPATDRVHQFLHGLQGGSFNRDNALVRNAGQLVEAGPDSSGNARYLLRQWTNDMNGFWMEAEFTQIPLSTVQAVIPGYVPTNN